MHMNINMLLCLLEVFTLTDVSAGSIGPEYEEAEEWDYSDDENDYADFDWEDQSGGELSYHQ